ncbi:M60 family metallopeptidase [Mucilaginibacter sp. SMC90]|uniref:M60 family metallopeptidase n=1 Tax=Mucilaginibacter sp. SMC90 TaxID=2929803 RepID=UPI001FB53E67|nr:M60 family metallopeptidase [Mucilaginibacter sp. SMC90]UOE48607.1 M60 family metallopeptidase [Mucilaginibacter sp. SMC90]
MLIKFFRNLFVFFLLLSVTLHSKAQTTKAILLKNVDTIPMPPVPEGVSLFTLIDEQPEIIAMTKFEIGENLKANVIVASTLGKGKVLAIGATAYFKNGMLKNNNVAQLLTNGLKWSSANVKKPQVAITKATDRAFRDFLIKQKASVYTIKNFDFKKKTDVLILNTDVTDSVQLNKIETFIVDGGTLIFGSPYSDMFLHRDTTKQFPYYTMGINKLLAKAGVVNPQTLIIQAPTNNKLVTDSVPDYLRVYSMLPRLFSEYTEKYDPYVGQYFVDPTLYLIYKYSPPGSPVIKHIHEFFNLPDEMPVPSADKPVPTYSSALKTRTRVAYKLYAVKQDFYNHPEAKAAGYKTFPGDVPENAPRVNETVTIPVRVGTQGLLDMPSVYYRPHSTGLYVPAGEKVKVVINHDDIKQHLKAQIGVHDDDLTHLDEIRRIPVALTKIFELDKDTTEVYSPYGGLLLINIGDTTKQKTVSIKVDGAVKSPYFKLGETSEQEWNNSIRNNPAPWAELATDNIVFTVPSYRIRYLNNPVKLMQFWDEVMDADADLAIISRKRVHQERIIIDVQPAYGSLFTIPQKIVAPDDESCAQMLDEAFMRSIGLWGHFHELGHRHQFFELDFPGTTEVTVNLFTMYVFDKVLHKGLYNHRDMNNMGDVVAKIKAYLADNPSYDKWSNDPFLALSMYIQIIDKFGWDAIKKANTVYRNLPKSQYPKTDQDKRDLWFTTICKTTNSNLTHFFDVWKIPVSDTAKKQVVAFKPWFPEELKGY